MAALSENPVDVAAGDVKKMVRSGARSIGQSVSDELAEKRAEVNRLKKLVTELRKLAKDKKVEYPTEITYSRTVRSGGDEYVVRTEELVLNDAEEVEKAADKIEKSLPNSAKVRDEVVADLKRKQDSLKDLTGNLSDLVESWRGVLREVLVTMR